MELTANGETVCRLQSALQERDNLLRKIASGIERHTLSVDDEVPNMRLNINVSLETFTTLLTYRRK